MLLALKNIAFPFFYVFDIVKDFIQLIILIIAVGGPMLVFNFWISFTSVVSWLNNTIQFISKGSSIYYVSKGLENCQFC